MTIPYHSQMDEGCRYGHHEFFIRIFFFFFLILQFSWLQMPLLRWIYIFLKLSFRVDDLKNTRQNGFIVRLLNLTGWMWRRVRNVLRKWMQHRKHLSRVHICMQTLKQMQKRMRNALCGRVSEHHSPSFAYVAYVRRTGKCYLSGVGTSKKNTFAIIQMWMYTSPLSCSTSSSCPVAWMGRVTKPIRAANE